MSLSIFGHTAVLRVVTSLLLASAPLVYAAPTVTYTFDGSGFTEGESTPIDNAAPDMDPANTGFTADFGDSAAAGSFVIDPGEVSTGESLFEPEAAVGLSIAGSVPLTEVSLDWVVNSSVADGTLVLTTNLGSMDVSEATGGSGEGNEFASGHLDFVSATPFTSFTLQGEGGSAATQLDVDNISLTLVPEPGSLALCGGAVIIALLGWSRSNRRVRQMPC